MDLYSMDMTDLTKNANVIKETLVLALERDGLLNKPSKEIMDSYVVIIAKPSWLGKLFRAIKGNVKDEQPEFFVMKSV